MSYLGVFLVPPAHHPFYRITAGILGYDIWTQQVFTSSLAPYLDSGTLATWLDATPVFGIHCTITGAALEYSDADVPEIRERMAWIAGRTAPFRLDSGRCDRQFRGAPESLVITFNSPDGALQRLHHLAATTISPLRVSSRYEPQLPRMSPRERELLHRVGEPWALDLYSPHWSLMTGLPDQAAWDTAHQLITHHTGLFVEETTRALQVSDIHLVQRQSHPTGLDHSTIIGSFTLTGSG